MEYEIDSLAFCEADRLFEAGEGEPRQWAEALQRDRRRPRCDDEQHALLIPEEAEECA